MNRFIIPSTAVAAVAACLASAPAAAQQNLNVQGEIAPYCNVNLTNVSSGTASVAMQGTQTIANLRLACNSPKGTKFILRTKNGDLVQTAGSMNMRINYDLILDSPNDTNFNIPQTDTYPGSGVEGRNQFTKMNAGYTTAVANGIPLVLSLNLNVQPDTDNTPTSQNYPATAAPAGTYSETFSFTASSV